MVCENGGQLFFVLGLQEALQRILGQFGKSLIRRGKNSVWPFGFQCVNQSSSLYGSHKSLEGFIAGCNIYYVTDSLRGAGS